jgi:tetratricopeptide (TPR) repeat protein
MAEQTEPIQRKVALKIIKPGMDSRQVIARFEAERQALALMDHVNIARVLDVGTTAAGRPYFVMELVHGVPITKYCDDHHLTPRERLELFVPVCQAIQHAHQKGIIHRDIKPSNMMVTLYDGKPVPKVIDFGVAKATEQKLTERTLFTQYGTMVGTLEYMSPEQAEMSALGVDTRSDIYSLGVLLYELLTGSTPLSHKRVTEAAYAEILRMIKEEEPQKPSTRLSDSGEALASISAQRHMEPAKLSKLVRGELDWIVMKTLEKDRNRRYETASGLAADVQRYLNDETVHACPPTLVYRFRKFARRNQRALVTAALLGVLLLVAVSVVAGSWGWVARDRATQHLVFEQEATRALVEAEQWQEQQQWREAVSAAKRADNLLPLGAGSRELRERVRELRKDLEMALRLDGLLFDLTSLKTDPLAFDFVKPETQFAAAFQDFGIDPDVLEPKEAGDLIQRRTIRLQLTTALDAWAQARHYAATKDKSWQRLLAVAQAADADPWRNRVRDALTQGNRPALMAVTGEVPISDVPPATLGLLGRALGDFGANQEMEGLLRRAQRRYPTSFWLNYDLAMALSKQEPLRLGEIVRFLSVAQALRPESPAAFVRLGDYLGRSGAWDEVVALCQEALRADPDFAEAHNQLGCALANQGKWDEAKMEYKQAIRLHYGPAYTGLGIAFQGQGDLVEAIACFRRAIECDPKGAAPHNHLGTALRDQGNLGEAIACYEKAIELVPRDAPAHNNLAWLLATCSDPKFRDPVRAIKLAKKAVELLPTSGICWNALGVAHYRAGEWNAADAALQKSFALMAGRQGSFNTFFLAMARWQLGDKEQARKRYEQARQWMEKNKPQDEELRRFRAEAAALLGLAIPPKEKP